MALATGQDSQSAEATFLEGLRAQYERHGFTFVAHPATRDLPPFFGAYQPDAIATKAGQAIAIEIKSRKSSATDLSLQRIRRLFEGQKDWAFAVAYLGSDAASSIQIPIARTATIHDQVKEIEALASDGHLRAAFVMAWSLLEAAMRRFDSEGNAKPVGPGTVVQTLAMQGLITPDMEQALRPMVVLRNRVVHGDLGAEPTIDDLDLVLAAVSQTLTEQAA